MPKSPSSVLLKLISGLQLLQALSRVRLLLADLKIPSARSWDGITASIADNWNEDVEAQFLELYEELRLFGRKHIFLYRSGQQLKKALPIIKGLKPSGAGAKAFPFPMEDPPAKPQLVAVREHGDRLVLVFASKRIGHTETPFSRDLVKEEALDELQGAQLWAKRDLVHTALDVISFHLKGIAPTEVKIDHFNHATEPGTAFARDAVLKAFHKLLAEAGHDQVVIGVEVDVSSAMMKLYKKPPEGKIVELGFICGTAARHRPVMTAKDGVDLREEKYHKKGMQAVGEAFDIYRLGVEWMRDDDGNVLEDARLIIPGTVGHLGDGGRALNEVLVSKMTGRAEYEFMLDRLARYVEAS